jgi:L-lactate dehydrogenase complex protein LldG
MSDPTQAFLARISRSLGRDRVPDVIPQPPTLDESLIRTGAGNGTTDVDLADRFVAAAEAAKMHVTKSSEATLADDAAAVLKSAGVRRLMLTRCPLFDRTSLIDGLKRHALDVSVWDISTLDASYDVDAGVTDVFRAVAETGTLAVRGSRTHGRAVSLVPMLHVAVVERWQIVPDLLDLMTRLTTDGTGPGTVLITGPSKTADIEMNLVVGVHGPGAVHILLV